MNKLIKIPLYIIAIFAIGIISGHFTFKILSFSKTVMVPDLRGKGMVDANDLLRKKGLYIRLEGEDYDSYIPQGYIIRQDIPPNYAVKEGREIGVVLSKGPKVRYVPDIVGQPFDVSEGILKEKGIRIGRVLYVHSDKVPKNIVLAQRPETNEKGGDNFSVIVSLGNFEK
ncbi:serine/threonine protein kinase [Dissulfurispira thermophila]|uniref:Serine/threonine protein kinase n=1 Tax=Dissulfurispira thermophila TaxID=2715679 RepID=A0A7G1H2R1_9BACT|nr:PASTA domain-containing protein [Dissulfurispira thermophila]BCB96968.1 serine/threonine protein kinase [Dissulfurispira thermophila]